MIFICSVLIDFGLVFAEIVEGQLLRGLVDFAGMAGVDSHSGVATRVLQTQLVTLNGVLEVGGGDQEFIDAESIRS